MILQDLIRNIVLYNGVIDPYLQSMKEYVISLINTSNKNNHLHSSQFHAYLSSKIEIRPLQSLTGTYTIPNLKNVYSNGVFHEKAVTISSSKIDSNSLFTMLTDKSIANSIQTHSFTESIHVCKAKNQTGTYVKLTTGSFNEKPNLFFSHETHEKREYLGEFSLPHEENQFNTLIGRR